MAVILQNVWILTRTGATLFSRELNSTFDEQYFGMFMSALNTYAEAFVGGGISSLEISDIRFSFVIKNGLIFVGTSPIKTKERKVFQEIEFIKNKFFNMYGTDVLDKFDGDLSQFDGFEKEIKSLFEDNLQNFLNKV